MVKKQFTYIIHRFINNSESAGLKNEVISNLEIASFFLVHAFAKMLTIYKGYKK